MYKKLLVTEKSKWYLQDLLYPITASVICIAFCAALLQRLNIFEASHALIEISALILAYLIVLFSATMAASHLRNEVSRLVFED